jgi:hypothetical protein
MKLTYLPAHAKITAPYRKRQAHFMIDGERRSVLISIDRDQRVEAMVLSDPDDHIVYLRETIYRIESLCAAADCGDREAIAALAALADLAVRSVDASPSKKWRKFCEPLAA